jgi:DNA-binding NtrC family response regulator
MRKIKLLLVDDEEDYVRTMAERLEMRDVGSRVALNGEQALEMIDEDAPDVMVLDLRMPGIDGMAVLERVRSTHPHVQVIVLTGHGSDREEREARRLGAFDYLQKPADTAKLLATVRSAWQRSLEFLRESKDRFDRSMTAAALAEAGLSDAARDHLAGDDAPGTAATAEEPGTGTSEEDGAARAAEPLKVLYVDDEEDFVRTMAERREMRDLGGDVALSGEAALAMFAEEVPDVMVLDLRMPGLDGLEVLRRVKAGYPQVAVIVMTGRGSDQDEEEATRLGAFAYLAKPVDITVLMETIRAAGRAARRPSSPS